MGRIITADRMEQIAAARAAYPEALGPILAELVIDGNIPVEAIAELLAVSKLTVYRWMYGEACPRDRDKIEKVKRLLTVLRKAKRARDLPLSGSMNDRIKATGQLVIKHRPLSKPQ